MNEQVKAILGENILGTLATVGEDGAPLATPLHMVAGDGAVYWFSQESSDHSKNLAREARASLAIFAPDTSQGLRGVYVSGRASVLGEEERTRVYGLFQSRLGSVPATFETARAYKLPIGTLDEQKSTGNCWYFYT